MSGFCDQNGCSCSSDSYYSVMTSNFKDSTTFHICSDGKKNSYALDEREAQDLAGTIHESRRSDVEQRSTVERSSLARTRSMFPDTSLPNFSPLWYGWVGTKLARRGEALTCLLPPYTFWKSVTWGNLHAPTNMHKFDSFAEFFHYVLVITPLENEWTKRNS